MAQDQTTIMWFRSDLRLADNPALLDAAEQGIVIPVFIWAPDEESDWSPGAARRWWLHHSLQRLDESLRQRSSRLIVRRGPTQAALRELLQATGASRVVWNRRYEPAVLERDRQIKTWLRQEARVQAVSFNSQLLHEPWTIQTQNGGPYKVFTPFWKNCRAQPLPPLPCPTPDNLPPPASWPRSDSIDSLSLEPQRDWKDGLATVWTPGEAAAQRQLQRFLDKGIRDYKVQRNVPAADGTSSLSPYLCHGEIGPRQIFHTVRSFLQDGRRTFTAAERDSVQTYVNEIGWREFAYHVLYHFPATPEQPLQAKYERFPWRQNADQLQAWQRGRTGYPIIDAGMRQLCRIGWMHNRLRMVVASFLVKDLLISWVEGERWFWDTLVDADLANNTLGWQWAGGCGADAAPYFRIFNPISQGETHDSRGDYVRQYVPELRELPAKLIHQPWSGPDQVLHKAGVELGENYPQRLVDHGEARAVALEALDQIKTS